MIISLLQIFLQYLAKIIGYNFLLDYLDYRIKGKMDY